MAAMTSHANQELVILVGFTNGRECRTLHIQVFSLELKALIFDRGLLHRRRTVSSERRSKALDTRLPSIRFA